MTTDILWKDTAHKLTVRVGVGWCTANVTCKLPSLPLLTHTIWDHLDKAGVCVDRL